MGFQADLLSCKLQALKLEDIRLGSREKIMSTRCLLVKVGKIKNSMQSSLQRMSLKAQTWYGIALDLWLESGIRQIWWQP